MHLRSLHLRLSLFRDVLLHSCSEYAVSYRAWPGTCVAGRWKAGHHAASCRRETLLTGASCRPRWGSATAKGREAARGSPGCTTTKPEGVCKRRSAKPTTRSTPTGLPYCPFRRRRRRCANGRQLKLGKCRAKCRQPARTPSEMPSATTSTGLTGIAKVAMPRGLP